MDDKQADSNRSDGPRSGGPMDTAGIGADSNDSNRVDADIITAEVIAADSASARYEVARTADSQRRFNQLTLPGFWMAVGWTISILVVQLVVSIPAAIIAIMAGADLERLQVTLVPVGTFSVAVYALLVTGAIFRTSALRVLAVVPFSVPLALIVLLLVPPMTIVGDAIDTWVRGWLPTIHGELFSEFAEQPWWLILLGGCLLPAIGEEILFRGFLGRGLVARFGPIAGILLTSILFGLVHVDPVQALCVIPLGVMFHLAYLASRSLLAPILMHTVLNGLAFILMAMGASIDGPQPTPWPLVAVAAVALVALTILLYTVRTQWVDADGAVWTPGYVTAECPPGDVAARRQSRGAPLAVLVVALAAYAGFVAVLVWAWDTIM